MALPVRLVRFANVLSLLAVLSIAFPAVAHHTIDPNDPLPVPKAQCGPGSDPESDLQGRVLPEEIDNGRAARGYRCNTELLGRFGLQNYQGAAGGFKTFRYVDSSGRECGYYDSTLLFPANVSAGELPGVYVMDMSDPTNPVRVTSLVTQAMNSPHESLVLHQGRGLLIAVLGNPTSSPGQIDIFDVTENCLEPQLVSSTPTGVLGHESGITPDGNTYWVASLDSGALTAVDISNPATPVTLKVVTGYRPHGLNTSDDGNRLYIAERNGLVILDVSEVQARQLNPQVSVVSTLDWEPIRSTPQVAIPVTIWGRPYLVEIDEFSDGDDNAGAARIIDIADEANPVIISDIRLEVHSPANRAALLGDYGSGPSDTTGFMGYNGHYCAVPQRTNPGVVACTFILSGMRLFDIRDPYHPTEIAYFNGPILSTNAAAGFDPAAYAMSAPVLIPEREEIWYADANSGFYAVRVSNDVWPLPEPSGPLGIAIGAALLVALRRRRHAAS